MERLKKFKFAVAVVSAELCIASCALIATRFIKSDGLPQTKLVFCFMIVLMIVGLIAIIAQAAVSKFSQTVAFAESGLSKGQTVNIIDYAHNRVIACAVDSASVDCGTIVIAVRTLDQKRPTIYIPLKDVFLDETSAESANDAYIRSQLDVVEGYFGIKLTDSGKEHFKQVFGTFYSELMVVTYHLEWDIEQYVDSMLSEMSKRNAIKDSILGKGYAEI